MAFKRIFKKLPNLPMKRLQITGDESIADILESLNADYLALVAHLSPGTLSDLTKKQTILSETEKQICKSEVVAFRKPELPIDYELSTIPNFKYGFEERDDVVRVMTLVYKDGTIKPLAKVSTYEPIQNSRVFEDAQYVASNSGGATRITSAGASPDGTKFEVSISYGSLELNLNGIKTTIRQVAKLWTSHDTSHAYNFAFSLIDQASSSILYWHLESSRHLPNLEKHLAEIKGNLQIHVANSEHFIQEVQLLSTISITKESPAFQEVLNIAVPYEKRFDKASWDMRAWLQTKITSRFENYEFEEGANAWVLYKAVNDFILERVKTKDPFTGETDISKLSNGDVKKQILVKELLLSLVGSAH